MNNIGHARVRALVDAGWLAGTKAVISSGETKAIETATPIAAALGIELEMREAMHENDRSATGFLNPLAFEQAADAFFTRPEVSYRGWERAVDAQDRIVRDVEKILARPDDGDILLVGHGGVGTLLLCHYSKLAISRAHDQTGGGGNYFSMRRDGRRVLHAWRRMENAPDSGA